MPTDPRLVFRPATGVYYMTIQESLGARRTSIWRTRTPFNVSSWVKNKDSMFPGKTSDCGTTVFFKDDQAGKPGAKTYAVATMGMLRGGNLSLVSSDSSMAVWKNEGVFLYNRPDHWDSGALSAGPSPVRLSDGSWLVLYNIDNLWPVAHPRPFPAFGRCALGWAVMDSSFSTVLARAEEPLLYAQFPFELKGQTDLVVYTDGLRALGDDTFVLYAAGADSVVEAVKIRVSVAAAGKSYSAGAV